MCYRNNKEVTQYDDLFRGSNPRTLAVAATGGRRSAKTTLLNNIDNYVCYTWEPV